MGGRGWRGIGGREGCPATPSPVARASSPQADGTGAPHSGPALERGSRFQAGAAWLCLGQRKWDAGALTGCNLRHQLCWSRQGPPRRAYEGREDHSHKRNSGPWNPNQRRASVPFRTHRPGRNSLLGTFPSETAAEAAGRPRRLLAASLIYSDEAIRGNLNVQPWGRRGSATVHCVLGRSAASKAVRQLGTSYHGGPCHGRGREKGKASDGRGYTGQHVLWNKAVCGEKVRVCKAQALEGSKPVPGVQGRDLGRIHFPFTPLEFFPSDVFCE